MNDAIPELYRIIRDQQNRIAKLEHQIQEIPNVWVVSALPGRLRKGVYILVDPADAAAPEIFSSNGGVTPPSPSNM